MQILHLVHLNYQIWSVFLFSTVQRSYCVIFYITDANQSSDEKTSPKDEKEVEGYVIYVRYFTASQ
jgi:hypothetical protein